jgi:hypothetical protein
MENSNHEIPTEESTQEESKEPGADAFVKQETLSSISEETVEKKGFFQSLRAEIAKLKKEKGEIPLMTIISMMLAFIAIVYLLFQSAALHPVPETAKEPATRVLSNLQGSVWQYDPLTATPLPIELGGIAYDRIEFSLIPNEEESSTEKVEYPVAFYLIDKKTQATLRLNGFIFYSEQDKSLVVSLPNGQHVQLLHSTTNRGFDENISLVGSENYRVYYVPFKGI